MADITNRILEAALLDQKIAGAFHGKRYAHVAVACDGGWQLGVAVANEAGYHPIEGKTFDQQFQATAWADGLNEHIGLSKEEAARIIVSTMGGRPI